MGPHVLIRNVLDCLCLLGLMMSSCVHVALARGHLAAAFDGKLQHMQLIVHVHKGLGLHTP